MSLIIIKMRNKDKNMKEIQNKYVEKLNSMLELEIIFIHSQTF